MKNFRFSTRRAGCLKFCGISGRQPDRECIFLHKRKRLWRKMPEVTYTPSLPILQAVLRYFVNGLKPPEFR